MEDQTEKTEEAEVKPAPRSLQPPTHAVGYKMPQKQTEQVKQEQPTKVNPTKFPAFYFSGNVELVSDGNGNVTLTFKQH